MAATNSTTNYGLPQWVATDKPTMADFNTAMADIDTNINLVQEQLEMSGFVFGDYTPVITGETTNPTVTYSIRRGNYFKNAETVSVSFFIRCTLTGGSGVLNVSIPFPFKFDDNAGVCTKAVLNVSSLGCYALVSKGAQEVGVRIIKTTGVNLSVSDVNNNNQLDLQGSIFYAYEVI